MVLLFWWIDMVWLCLWAMLLWYAIAGFLIIEICFLNMHKLFIELNLFVDLSWSRLTWESTPRVLVSALPSFFLDQILRITSLCCSIVLWIYGVRCAFQRFFFFLKMVPFNTLPIKFCISFDMEVKFMTCCRVQGQELFLMRTLRKRPQVFLNSAVYYYYQLKLEAHCQFIWFIW